MVMDNEIYKQVLEDAFKKAKESIFDNLSSEDFDWDQLIDLVIEEESPLQEVFSSKVVLLCELFSQSKKMSTVLSDIEDFETKGEEEENMLETSLQTEEDLPQESKADDVFADFEDVE